LKQEYLICLIFVVIMFVVIWGFIEKFVQAYTAIAFLIGAITSIISGTIGMMIATYTNYRVTHCAKQGLDLAFRTAYRGGCVMGFALVSIGLLSNNSLI
jgi:inorganic pyrophosphatase